MEVQALLDEVINDYESKLFEQKNRISDLIAQNEQLTRKNDYFESKEELITETLKNATKKAQEIVDDANIIYNIASEKLTRLEKNIDAFCKKYLCGTFSLKKAEKLKEIKRDLTAISKDTTKNERKIDKANKILSNGKSIIVEESKIPDFKKKQKVEFNPEMLLQEYFESTVSSGFNMEEITNTNDNDLEDLCKEMGLT